MNTAAPVKEEMMQINQEEALAIIDAIRIAEVEMGKCEEWDNLVKKIRENFPEIHQAMAKSEYENELWSVRVEQDPRVIEMRIAFEERQKLRYQTNHERYSWLEKEKSHFEEFAALKAAVAEEIRAKDKETGNAPIDT